MPTTPGMNAHKTDMKGLRFCYSCSGAQTFQDLAETGPKSISATLWVIMLGNLY